MVRIKIDKRILRLLRGLAVAAAITGAVWWIAAMRGAVAVYATRIYASVDAYGVSTACVSVASILSALAFGRLLRRAGSTCPRCGGRIVDGRCLTCGGAA
jgi:hypothetical protein